MLRASLQTPRGRSQYLWAGPTDFAGRSQQLWAGPPDLVGRPTGKSPDRPDGHPASAPDKMHVQYSLIIAYIRDR